MCKILCIGIWVRYIWKQGKCKENPSETLWQRRDLSWVWLEPKTMCIMSTLFVWCRFHNRLGGEYGSWSNTQLALLKCSWGPFMIMRALRASYSGWIGAPGTSSLQGKNKRQGEVLQRQSDDCSVNQRIGDWCTVQRPRSLRTHSHPLCPAFDICSGIECFWRVYKWELMTFLSHVKWVALWAM